MKVTVIPIVISALGAVTKGLVQGSEDLEIKERVKTILVVKLATVVEGDQKAPFPIATTPEEGRALLLSLDCSTLPLIRTLYCWVLSKGVSSTIFKVFGITRPGIEPRSPGLLANTLLTRPEYWEESWRIEVTSCHSNSGEKPSANVCVKNSPKSNNSYWKHFVLNLSCIWTF